MSEERPAWRRWATGLFEAFTVKQLVFGAFLVVLVLSIPFGGMRAAAKPKPVAVKLDHEVAVAPFTITLKGAWQTQDVGVPLAGKIEGRYLIVAALIRTRARTSVPVGALEEAVRLVGVPGLQKYGSKPATAARSTTVPADSMLVDGDFFAMGDLPPDTTYGLYWVFTLAPGFGAPKQVTVELRRQTYRKSSIDQSLGYFDARSAGRGRLTVGSWRQPVEESGP